jgi:hypothetical protein
MIRLIYMVPIWLAYILFISTPAYHFTWPFMKLWDNQIDGIANTNYYKARNMFLQILYWYNRNPVDGLRNVPPLSDIVRPEKVRYIMAKDMSWYLCWQSWFHSNLVIYFRYDNKLYKFWIGTIELYPSDEIPKRDYGYRRYGSGGVLQLKKLDRK